MPTSRQGVSYYRVSEAAEILGVHRNTIIHWIKEQKTIKAEKLGIADKSPYIISSDEINRVIKEMTGADTS